MCMTKLLRWTMALVTTLAVAACGGGGSGGAGDSVFGGGDGGTGGTATAADIVLVLDKSVVSNSGAETVTATAYALDANRNALAGVPVVIRPDDTALAQSSGNTTGTNGVVTATISLGANLSNRTVTVTAVSGGIARAQTFLVTGTSGGSTGQQANDLVVLLNKTIVSNTGLETVTATVIALDTNRNAMSGIPVSVKVDSDAIANVSAATTSAAGIVTADVSLGNNLANRTVTVTAVSGAITRTAAFQVANSSGTTQVVSDLQIRLSAASIDNSGNQSVNATITAVDNTGKGLSGVPITLTVDRNATYTFTGASAGSTAADGTVTANITIGNDFSVRTITLTAVGGNVSESTSFNVTGNRLVASEMVFALAATSIPNSITNTVLATVTALDANRNVLANIPVSFKVDSGAVQPLSLVTSANGTISALVSIGADRSNRDIKVTATSGSTFKDLPLAVVGSKISAAPSATQVALGSAHSVRFKLSDNAGAAMAKFPYTVTATGLPGLAGDTDASGEFEFKYTAPLTESSINIKATAGGVSETVTIKVGSDVVDPASPNVTSASVSATPSVVAVNTPNATAPNKVEVKALFLAANNLPVQNVRAWFDLAGDSQRVGGTFERPTTGTYSYSDAGGVARISYVPGARFSPKDGVTRCGFAGARSTSRFPPRARLARTRPQRR